MNEDVVSRETVIHVFEQVSSTLNISFSADGSQVTIIKGAISDVFDLPYMIPRKMLHFFHRKYDIRIEFFFHPEMIHKSSDTVQ